MSKILIGNKCDLEDKRQITVDSAKALAQEYGMEYLETSAAEEVNIDNAFRQMAKMILERTCSKVEETDFKKLFDQRKSNLTSSRCCK